MTRLGSFKRLESAELQSVEKIIGHIMYTRADFGLELKEWVRVKQDVAHIGHWTYSIYLDHIDDIDMEFRHILITLNYMEDGPEFALSYERLNEIADDLIAGKKDINLDY